MVKCNPLFVNSLSARTKVLFYLLLRIRKPPCLPRWFSGLMFICLTDVSVNNSRHGLFLLSDRRICIIPFSCFRASEMPPQISPQRLVLKLFPLYIISCTPCLILSKAVPFCFILSHLFALLSNRGMKTATRAYLAAYPHPAFLHVWLLIICARKTVLQPRRLCVTLLLC